MLHQNMVSKICCVTYVRGHKSPRFPEFVCPFRILRRRFFEIHPLFNLGILSHYTEHIDIDSGLSEIGVYEQFWNNLKLMWRKGTHLKICPKKIRITIFGNSTANIDRNA